MSFCKFFVAIFFLSFASRVDATAYPKEEIFELVLFGEGYDDALETKAWNQLTSIFEACFGTAGFRKIEEGGKRRSLRGKQEQEVEEEQNEQERQLLTTCPASCKGKTTQKCIYLCGSGGGRRVLAEGSVYFNKSDCQNKINAAIDKFTKKQKGTSMKAVINV